MKTVIARNRMKTTNDAAVVIQSCKNAIFLICKDLNYESKILHFVVMKGNCLFNGIGKISQFVFPVFCSYSWLVSQKILRRHRFIKIRRHEGILYSNSEPIFQKDFCHGLLLKISYLSCSQS